MVSYRRAGWDLERVHSGRIGQVKPLIRLTNWEVILGIHCSVFTTRRLADNSCADVALFEYIQSSFIHIE